MTALSRNDKTVIIEIEIVDVQPDKLEKMLKQVVKVLASNTNYATMITGPAYHQARLRFIQLSRVNELQLLAVVVAEGNLVKNKIIDIDEPIDEESLLKLNLLLNTQMNGKTIGEINLDMISLMSFSLPPICAPLIAAGRYTQPGNKLCCGCGCGYDTDRS